MKPKMRMKHRNLTHRTNTTKQ